MDALAEREERPRSWIVEHAVADYLAAAGVKAAKPPRVRRKAPAKSPAAEAAAG
jgi:predicted transcriptional regulator